MLLVVFGADGQVIAGLYPFHALQPRSVVLNGEEGRNGERGESKLHENVGGEERKFDAAVNDADSFFLFTRGYLNYRRYRHN